MEEKLRVTFKKEKRETGRMGVGRPYQSVYIKVNKKICGMINAPTWQTKDNKWSVSLSVIKNDIMEDGNENCDWMNKQFRQRFDTEEDARIFVRETLIPEITKKYKLKTFDDEY